MDSRLDPSITESTELYALLGINPDATEADIKRAYRKTALKYHPDSRSKNLSTSQAAQYDDTFLLLGVAQKTLLDPQLRAVYDGILNARKQREQERLRLTEDRRRKREDLEKREKEAAVRYGVELSATVPGLFGGRASGAARGAGGVRKDVLSTVEQNRKLEQLKREGRRLRQLKAERELSKTRLYAIANEKSVSSGGKDESAAPPAPHNSTVASSGSAEEADHLVRTLKVKYRLKDDKSPISDRQLTRLFAVFGPVEELIASKPRGRKGTCVVVFRHLSSAQRAVEEFTGKKGYSGGLFSGLESVAALVRDVAWVSPPENAGRTVRSEGIRKLDGKGMSFDMYRKLTLDRMREADRLMAG